ncbi:MAG TPA: glutamine--tRNA ligase/YqeY domain fusion protein [Bacteroidales bacterium]|nr:glutamine--tRNA ligase/YqeY domain fusion protein [Bacteroidales bacterium]
MDSDNSKTLNFIEEIVEEDLRSGKNGSRIHTRFPPEPNGYIHIGHAKAICLSFGIARKYNGKCNLRFDDTNPVTEDVEYVDSIKEDIQWLGFNWNGEARYASDYFDQLFDWAVKLIKIGKAYVDEGSADDISAERGTPTQAGKESAYRNRSVEENLDLFIRMKNGEFPDGSKILRAKIDMTSPNMHMRDPVMYRIKHAHHHRTGDKWCIYPMYDWAHGQSDYIEGITHSLCTLEFEVHRPLYDWCLDQIVEGEYRPRQIEFARLNLNYTIMSKRKMLQLVNEKYVSGWDDPRMPTICGLRRRGFTPEALRNFAETVGIAKRENIIELALLEHILREDLNKSARRVMVVSNPLKVILENYPEGKVEFMQAENNPEDESAGFREIPFSRELYIEQEDFMEDPPKKFFRLSPGNEVRLKNGYIIKCTGVVKDPATGAIQYLKCTYDETTRSGLEGANRKVKATIHWVSAAHALDVEVRLYDRLFSVPDPDEVEEGKDWKSNLNPDSLKVITAKAEPGVKEAKPLEKYQFQRTGYFCVDKDSTPSKIIFNRTVTLKDDWAKIAAKA